MHELLGFFNISCLTIDSCYKSLRQIADELRTSAMFTNGFLGHTILISTARRAATPFLTIVVRGVLQGLLISNWLLEVVSVQSEPFKSLQQSLIVIKLIKAWWQVAVNRPAAHLAFINSLLSKVEELLWSLSSIELTLRWLGLILANLICAWGEITG